MVDGGRRVPLLELATAPRAVSPVDLGVKRMLAPRSQEVSLGIALSDLSVSVAEDTSVVAAGPSITDRIKELLPQVILGAEAWGRRVRVRAADGALDPIAGLMIHSRIARWLVCVVHGGSFETR